MIDPNGVLARRGRVPARSFSSAGGVTVACLSRHRKLIPFLLIFRNSI